MAGIYIHIPFCKKACRYCNFHFSTTLKSKPELLSALGKEIGLRADYFDPGTKIDTIYFGGGTPSLLTEKELKQILKEIYTHFNITSDAEITFEVNPDDINLSVLKMLKRVEINRLSIGIQSFYDDILKWMNREHDSKQGKKAISEAQDVGFNNITIDLIYGFPMLKQALWEDSLEQVKKLGIQHISAYQLTLEKGTVLYHDYKKHLFTPSEDDIVAEQFETIVDFANKEGFEHYEISNFSRPGFVSKHNSSYWLGKPYLGLGPSAHSYQYPYRRWNVANNGQYIKAIENNKSFSQEEFIDETKGRNEYILTRLRTKWGMDLSFFDEQYLKAIYQKAKPYIESRHLIEKDNTLYLTQKGKMLADRITSDLFF